MLRPYQTVAGCGSSEPESAPDESSGPLASARLATERTLEAGPSNAILSLRSSAGAFELAGPLDLSTGYKFCGEIVEAVRARGGSVWLGERDGAVGTYLKGGPPCPESGWFNDHPPTLEFAEPIDIRQPIKFGEIGAEDFFHAALLAMTQLDEASTGAVRAGAKDGNPVYSVVVDFEAFDRRSPYHGDDNVWTLRPLVRAMGQRLVLVGLDDEGQLSRLKFDVPLRFEGDRNRSPVAVDLALDEIGDADEVPEVEVTAIE